jgi:hypothetical protein
MTNIAMFGFTATLPIDITVALSEVKAPDEDENPIRSLKPAVYLLV